MREANAVPHQNTVFREVLKHVPWGLFERLVEQHGNDRLSRCLTSKDQVLAMLYAQLAGASSLREVTAGLESHQKRLYHVGGCQVKRSTLADANAKRSSEPFAGLFAALVKRAHRGLRKAIGDSVHLIDSTGLKLSGLGSEWARFSKKTVSAKLHIVFDPDADQPVYAAVTTGKTPDIRAAHRMPITAGVTYVFDLGYYDYVWWAKLTEAACRIVTRIKTNTPFTLVETLAVPQGGNVISDQIGFLPERLARQRHNPLDQAVRQVTVRMDNGKELRLLSNDLDAPAQEIADLYKRRWAIELFFRWVKQTLRIRTFLGRSENAVRIQVAVALIAYLLLRLAQATQTAVLSPLAFVRLVRANLMDFRRIDHLLKAPPTVPKCDRQDEFAWT